jgi:hypothetical protein
MVSMTFFTFSLMMPSHYEGSGVFPEILGKDRMMVEQRNFGIGQETTLGREARKGRQRLSTSGDAQSSHPLKLYVLLVMGLGGAILHDLRVPRE